MANIKNCFIKSNVCIATASGWLHRLVRPTQHVVLVPVLPAKCCGMQASNEKEISHGRGS